MRFGAHNFKIKKTKHIYLSALLMAAVLISTQMFGQSWTPLSSTHLITTSSGGGAFTGNVGIGDFSSSSPVNRLDINGGHVGLSPWQVSGVWTFPEIRFGGASGVTGAQSKHYKIFRDANSSLAI